MPYTPLCAQGSAQGFCSAVSPGGSPGGTQDQLSQRCLRPRSSEMSRGPRHLFRPSLTAEPPDLEAFSPGSKLSKICSQCPHHAEARGFPDTHPLL